MTTERREIGAIFVAGEQVVGARGAKLTTQLTTVTCSSPGTPDYAIADPVTITAYGFTSADEFLSTVKVIANLQTRLGELEDRLQATGGHGLIADPT